MMNLSPIKTNTYHQLLITLFLITLISSSCKQDSLSFEQLTESPGYFIEAYLVPNEIYKLSATRVQPISEEYILDYAINFEVYIDDLRLNQSLYQDSKSEYFYNYGHPDLFLPSEKKTIKLLAISPNGDTITANTTVPPPVQIIDIRKEKEHFHVTYSSSNDNRFNYFILNTIQYISNNKHRHSIFIDQSNSNSKILESLIEIKSETCDSTVFEIKRCTKANYDYQVSLWRSINANSDNLTFPTPLIGNIDNAIGIFTVYTKDKQSVIN